MDHIKPFRVHLGGRRFRRFRTMAEASKYCNKHFQGTGVVLSIEAKTASIVRARKSPAHTSAHTSHVSRP